jgi:hypothetical protein
MMDSFKMEKQPGQAVAAVRVELRKKTIKNLPQEFRCTLGFLDGLILKKTDDQRVFRYSRSAFFSA